MKKTPHSSNMPRLFLFLTLIWNGVDAFSASLGLKHDWVSHRDRNASQFLKSKVRKSYFGFFCNEISWQMTKFPSKTKKLKKVKLRTQYCTHLVVLDYEKWHRIWWENLWFIHATMVPTNDYTQVFNPMNSLHFTPYINGKRNLLVGDKL